ncbi:hypothetical protein GWO60_08275 [Corynebacterium macginleyi]|uniref:Uncharacterized protein n=2 Tax=Corynebacterium macginleyi TaxID=38290 RepID=A0A3M0GLT0_9CORY|nr:hypothetical protein [Corynebacterium macginleyi]MBK4149681.1 hypothetical protein [Corynebacterium macginleyi]MBK4156735.1 hypothetical protein [Corynebacterium macginleyi]MBK4160369.1 hypothetical protein [Corynebacterium macginleyi]MBK4165171.1 hypothetical protein [Corynebacterium macginleyi]MBK4167085.1 hypothetical protein [Corynebacterium macginleyi]
MNEQHKRRYRARIAVAQLFRSVLNKDGERVRLMKSLGVETMPVIIPALGDTLASDIREASSRHFKTGAEHVVVPVCLPVHNPVGIKLCVLIVSTHDAKTFWQLDMNELHDSVEMAQVVEALDAAKKWEIEELDSEQQKEFKDLAASI